MSVITPKQKMLKTQANRTRLLAEINRKVNQHLFLNQGLFEVAGRCLYTVAIVPGTPSDPPYAEVHVIGSHHPKSKGQTILLCNQQLYGQCRYWGQIQLVDDKWQFSRTTNIKDSRSVFTGNVLFGFEVSLYGLVITRQTLDELFGRYIKEADAQRQLLANQITGRAQG